MAKGFVGNAEQPRLMTALDSKLCFARKVFCGSSYVLVQYQPNHSDLLKSLSFAVSNSNDKTEEAVALAARQALRQTLLGIYMYMVLLVAFTNRVCRSSTDFEVRRMLCISDRHTRPFQTPSSANSVLALGFDFPHHSKLEIECPHSLASFIIVRFHLYSWYSKMNHGILICQCANRKLASLTELDVSWNKLVNLPPDLGALIHLKSIDLSANLLVELPFEGD